MATNSSSVYYGAILGSIEWRILAGFLYVSLFIVGTIGNLLVIYVFGWQKRGRRKSTEQLLFSLGIWDLATSAVLAPLMAFMALYSGNNIVLWYKIGCQVIPVVLAVCITLSQYIVILISYDRYRAIVTPLQERTCILMIRIGAVIAIIVGFILVIPSLIQSDNEQLEQEICFDYTDKGPLIISQAVIYVVRDILSFAVMAYFIRKMLIALRNSPSLRREFSSKTQSKKANDFNRAKKILYSVLVLFVILVWPTDLCFLGVFLYYNGHEYEAETTELIMVIIMMIMLFQTINSTVNVFIYSAIHPDFKKFLTQAKAAVCHKSRSEEDDIRQGNSLPLSQPRIG